MLVKTNQLANKNTHYNLLSELHNNFQTKPHGIINTKQQQHTQLHASTIMLLQSSPFWVFTQCWLVVVYRFFGTAYLSRIQWSSSPTT
jgi:hypothetical protein